MVLFLVQYNCRPSSFWEGVEKNNDYPVLDFERGSLLASNNIISNQYSGRMFLSDW